MVGLLSQKGAPDAEALTARMPGHSLDQGDVRFTIEDEPGVDVVVVINYLKYDTTIHARAGYIWNWHNEPIVRQPFAQGYDRIYTHVTQSGDPRVRNAPPLLDWWIDKSFDDLKSLEMPEKTSLVSAIASTKTMIPGHQRRNDFIEALTTRYPEVDVFGHGRARSLDDKWSGLAPYRYSIAIENTSSPHYWTEKIADCFLSYTVPVYFGATNIGDYFPEDSFIWLPLDQPEVAVETIERLSKDDWSARIPALEEARRRMLENYSLVGQITKRVTSERETILSSPRVSTRVHGRRTRPGGWIRGIGLTGNLRAKLDRRRQRQSRQFREIPAD
mgnify:FL=1